MKYSSLYRELNAAGCYIIRRTGGHDIWRSPITRKDCPVPRHPGREVPVRILKSVRRDLLGK